MSPPLLPLVEELSPVPTIPAALAAFRTWSSLLLLESPLQRESVGRYSFLMADPYRFETLSTPTLGQDPLRDLRTHFAETITPARPDLPPFQGGAAGLLSYDLGRVWERIPPPRCDEFQLPALAVGWYDWVLAWDHQQQRAWLISQGTPETDSARRQHRAQTRLRQVRDQLLASPAAPPTPARSDSGGDQKPHVPPLSLAPQYPAPGPPGLTSNFSRDAYLDAICRATDYIHAGDIFQVNLSQRLLYPLQDDPLHLYLRLRERNPAPFAGYFAHDDWVIASASPERFLSVQQGLVETRPIKGTRQRQRIPEADLFTRDELRESEKDQAENVMIVDLLRNDLSRVCAPGTIRVPELCRVETYETVQHLVSVVQGQLAPGKTAWDLWPATFPGGSITGAPKVRAMQIIAELEPTARGPYCGSLFYLSYTGNMDSSILIRTFTIRHHWIQCPVGGGIVADSSPPDEYQETLHKATGMLRALTP